jgi:hypothetical protein
MEFSKSKRIFKPGALTKLVNSSVTRFRPSRFFPKATDGCTARQRAQNTGVRRGALVVPVFRHLPIARGQHVEKPAVCGGWFAEYSAELPSIAKFHIQRGHIYFSLCDLRRGEAKR